MLAAIKIENGDIVLEKGSPVWVTGAKAIRQRLEIMLKMFLGDWYYDQNAGIPWMAIVELENEQIKEIIKNKLLKDEYVKEVKSIDVERDKRNMKINFRTNSVEGIVEGSTVIGGLA